MILTPDPQAWPFAALVETMVGMGPLERLHEHGSPDHLLVPGEDQTTPYHRAFYASPLLPAFVALYREFVREVVAPVLQEQAFVAQAVPTFRVHLPGNLSVGEFHTDGQYGHPEGSRTVWVACTPARGSAAMQIESAPGAKDYAPLNLDAGQVAVLDTRDRHHGNWPNVSDRTRVSFDARLLTWADYDRFAAGPVVYSKAAGRPMRLGGYYRALAA